MKTWPHFIDTHSTAVILTAVDDENWQMFRKSLKGISTENKLDLLNARYLERWINGGSHEEKVRIDNYINALKRGGLLNSKLEVVR